MKKKKIADNLASVQTSSLKTACGSENLFNRTTELCCDVKTHLLKDKRTVVGKPYHGTLTRDEEYHFSFVETPSVVTARNPHLYKGDFINATLESDGNIRLSFRRTGNGKQHTPMTYAINVATEVFEALSLVEK